MLATMNDRRGLTDEQWRRLAPVVSGIKRRGSRAKDDRCFFEGVVWVLRAGAPWRDLPGSFGKWSTVYRRFRRWAVGGRWESLRRALAGRETPYDLLLIDSTIVKAHPHSAGARKGAGGQAGEALGRSRSGFTTKIHAVVSGKGMLLRHALTGGEAADVTQARALVQGLRGHVGVGDRAYDSDAFLDFVQAQGMVAVIPSRANRRIRRVLEINTYAIRNVIERLFGRLKQFRRLATRYDKTSTSYAATLVMATVLVVLSGWVS